MHLYRWARQFIGLSFICLSNTMCNWFATRKNKINCTYVRISLVNKVPIHSVKWMEIEHSNDAMMATAPQLKCPVPNKQWTHRMNNCMGNANSELVVSVFRNVCTLARLLPVGLWMHINMHINRNNNLWHVLCTKRSQSQVVWLALPLFGITTLAKHVKTHLSQHLPIHSFIYIIFASENIHWIEAPN